MSHPSPIYLGIDPGTAITGYGVVTEDHGTLSAIDFGVIRTTPDQALHVRLIAIYDGISDLCKKHQPEAVAVEELFFSKNARTALSVGHARGVVLLAAAQTGKPLFEYKPSEVKQAVTGYGAADKHQVQEMVRLLLGLETVPKPDDAADALAVAICHLHAAPLKRLT